MATTNILFLIGFIMIIGIVTMTESTLCVYGGGYCNAPNTVCCNSINPGHCCPTGKYCCGRAVNFGCCPIGYTCGLTQCIKYLRNGDGPAQVAKTNAAGHD